MNAHESNNQHISDTLTAEREQVFPRVVEFAANPDNQYASGADIKRGTGLSWERVQGLGYNNFSELRSDAAEWQKAKDTEAARAAEGEAFLNNGKQQAKAWNAEVDQNRNDKIQQETYRQTADAWVDSRTQAIVNKAMLHGKGRNWYAKHPEELEKLTQHSKLEAEIDLIKARAADPSVMKSFNEAVDNAQMTRRAEEKGRKADQQARDTAHRAANPSDRETRAAAGRAQAAEWQTATNEYRNDKAETERSIAYHQDQVVKDMSVSRANNLISEELAGRDQQWIDANPREFAKIEAKARKQAAAELREAADANPEVASHVRNAAIYRAAQEGHSTSYLEPTYQQVTQNPAAEARQSEYVRLLKAHDQKIAAGFNHRAKVQEANANAAKAAATAATAAAAGVGAAATTAAAPTASPATPGTQANATPTWGSAPASPAAANTAAAAPAAPVTNPNAAPVAPLNRRQRFSAWLGGTAVGRGLKNLSESFKHELTPRGRRVVVGIGAATLVGVGLGALFMGGDRGANNEAANASTVPAAAGSVTPTPESTGKATPAPESTAKPKADKEKAPEPLTVEKGDFPYNVVSNAKIADPMEALDAAAKRSGYDYSWHGQGTRRWIEVNGKSSTEDVMKLLDKYIVR